MDADTSCLGRIRGSGGGGGNRDVWCIVPLALCQEVSSFGMWGGYREVWCITPRCFVFWCLTPVTLSRCVVFWQVTACGEEWEAIGNLGALRQDVSSLACQDVFHSCI